MAVFLTSINVVDTGYLTVTGRTGQLLAADRVFGGLPLQLKVTNFEITSTASLDEGVTPAFLPSDIQHHEVRSLVSISPLQVSMSVLVNSSDVDTTNTWGINDTAMLLSLLRLPHTRGFKAIFYPVDNSLSAVYDVTSRKLQSQAVYQLGLPDSTEPQGDLNLTLWTGSTSASSKTLVNVNYVPVRFKTARMTQSPDNKIMVLLTGEVTG